MIIIMITQCLVLLHAIGAPFYLEIRFLNLYPNSELVDILPTQ
jgi:hypothetical protein